MIELYRIENEKTMHGMWYEEDGTYNPFIKRLSEGKSAMLPMGFSSLYSDKGLNWNSACNSIEDMQKWFSNRDALELFQSGYKLFKFKVHQYRKEPHEVLFTRDSIVEKTEISLDTIWDIDNNHIPSLVVY